MATLLASLFSLEVAVGAFLLPQQDEAAEPRVRRFAGPYLEEARWCEHKGDRRTYEEVSWFGERNLNI